MPSLTRRALVALAALGPAAALAAPGSAATGSGPPPPPEAEALLERATYRGDLDVLLRKGTVRVLTAYSKTDFFVDKGESGAVAKAVGIGRRHFWCGDVIPTALVGDRFGALAAGDRGEAVGHRREPVPRLAAGGDDG